MTRHERNELIVELLSNGEISNVEATHFTQVSGVVGDSEEIPIDWDDLRQATSLDYVEIEDILMNMSYHQVLETLDFEEDVYG